MYGGPAPFFDVFSFLVPVALVLGAVYVAVALTQRRASAAEGVSGTGLDNLALRTLYTLAVAALVAAFVGFGIEVVYPSPEYPEYPEGEMMMYGPAEGEGPTPEMREAEARFQRGMDVYEREPDAHNRVASVVAVGLVVLLVALYLKVRPGNTAGPDGSRSP